jgi:hypothetical protein
MQELSEYQVYHLWQQATSDHTYIADTGQRVSVLFPGRTCTNGGCDFQDAILKIDGKTIIGNVEIHVLASHWISHKHHRDKLYNGVELQVVMWQDTTLPAVLQNRKKIPTISLLSSLPSAVELLPKKTRSFYHFVSLCPYSLAFPKVESLISLLKFSGRKRFFEKVKSFKRALSVEEAGQVLFRNIAGTLGYSKNIIPFEKVADKITLRKLESIDCQDSLTRQALILGTAGLLPSQRFKEDISHIRNVDAATLEKIWKSFDLETAINLDDWCFFRVRPGNFPVRRLIALSYLIGQFSHGGLLQGMLDLIREPREKEEHRWIENKFITEMDDYWLNHIDFGVLANRNMALVGRARITEMVINVVLPFAYAYGSLSSEPALRKNAIKTFVGYPAAGDNQIIKYMRQQFMLKSGLAKSSLIQQGLLHIYKRYCFRRECNKCLVAVNRN